MDTLTQTPETLSGLDRAGFKAHAGRFGYTRLLAEDIRRPADSRRRDGFIGWVDTYANAQGRLILVGSDRHAGISAATVAAPGTPGQSISVDARWVDPAKIAPGDLYDVSPFDGPTIANAFEALATRVDRRFLTMVRSGDYASTSTPIGGRVRTLTRVDLTGVGMDRVRRLQDSVVKAFGLSTDVADPAVLANRIRQELEVVQGVNDKATQVSRILDGGFVPTSRNLLNLADRVRDLVPDQNAESASALDWYAGHLEKLAASKVAREVQEARQAHRLDGIRLKSALHQWVEDRLAVLHHASTDRDLRTRALFAEGRLHNLIGIAQETENSANAEPKTKKAAQTVSKATRPLLDDPFVLDVDQDLSKRLRHLSQQLHGANLGNSDRMRENIVRADFAARAMILKDRQAEGFQRRRLGLFSRSSSKQDTDIWAAPDVAYRVGLEQPVRTAVPGLIDTAADTPTRRNDARTARWDRMLPEDATIARCADVAAGGRSAHPVDGRSEIAKRHHGKPVKSVSKLGLGRSNKTTSADIARDRLRQDSALHATPEMTEPKRP